MNQFIKNTLILALAIVLNSCNQESVRPNIVLFMVDDLGWQDTSEPFWTEETLFNKRYHTPNMERLADEGMKFTQAYACAVCSPTRVSLMTGMNAARHRVTNWTLKRDTMMIKPRENLTMPNWNMNGMAIDRELNNAVYTPQPLPKVLQNNGYKTIHAGKAHFASIGTPASDPTNIGFSVNIAGHAAGSPGSYYGTDNYGNKTSTIRGVPGLEEYHGKEVFLTEALTQKAIQEVDKAVNEEKPFFLYMAHYAVHTPIMGDPRFEQKYLDTGLDSIEARYASLVEGMDKSLGDLLYYLDTSKLADNTIILFISDNGGLSAVARGGEKHSHNYPLSSGKGSIREGGIREPMIVKWPGVVKANSVCNDYLIIEDFYPTILDMAGVQKLKGECQTIDGISFIDLLEGKNSKTGDRSLFWHYPNNWGPTGPGIGAYSAIRKGDWKLIYFHASQRFELFNITLDISEQNNLAIEEKEIKNNMVIELGEYLRSANAQMPSFKTTGKKVPWPDEVVK